MNSASPFSSSWWDPSLICSDAGLGLLPALCLAEPASLQPSVSSPSSVRTPADGGLPRRIGALTKA